MSQRRLTNRRPARSEPGFSRQFQFLQAMRSHKRAATNLVRSAWRPHRLARVAIEEWPSTLRVQESRGDGAVSQELVRLRHGQESTTNARTLRKSIAATDRNGRAGQGARQNRSRPGTNIER